MPVTAACLLSVLNSLAACKEQIAAIFALNLHHADHSLVMQWWASPTTWTLACRCAPSHATQVTHTSAV